MSVSKIVVFLASVPIVHTLGFVPLARCSGFPRTLLSASRVTESSRDVSRRELLEDAFRITSAAVAVGGLAPSSAFAEEGGDVTISYEDIPVSKNKVGGLLEPYAEVGKGWRILKPYGWNQFEQKPGVYEAKWTDIVASNRQELVVVTSPVKSTTTSIAALGDVQAVGQKLASARSAELVSAKAVKKEGVLFYMFEFKNSDIHQVYQLCVSKGKLWSVDASAPAKRWDKVENLFNNALLSFMPKL